MGGAFSGNATTRQAERRRAFWDAKREASARATNRRNNSRKEHAMPTDARTLIFVKRMVWLPRLCNHCWRFLWLVMAYVRLQTKCQAVQILCRRCGDARLI